MPCARGIGLWYDKVIFYSGVYKQVYKYSSVYVCILYAKMLSLIKLGVGPPYGRVSLL